MTESLDVTILEDSGKSGYKAEMSVSETKDININKLLLAN